VFKRSIPVISLATLFLCLPLALSQVSTDWRKRYGQPASERYVIRDQILMTVFYSQEGRTCKAIVEPAKPQPPGSFEEVLNEIIPIGDRGKEISSLGLTTGALTAIAYTDYERVRISLASSGEGTTKGATTGNIVLATIEWHGVQCKLPEQKQKQN
jgi:hypothetical protein